VYNLVQQGLLKKLQCAVQRIASLALHPGGDNLIVGSECRRVCWFDMDLSTKPYKTIKYHRAAVNGVAFHRAYPLFASASSDGAVHVFHQVPEWIIETCVARKIRGRYCKNCRNGTRAASIGNSRILLKYFDSQNASQ
jgi:hypothetical protein